MFESCAEGLSSTKIRKKVAVCLTVIKNLFQSYVMYRLRRRQSKPPDYIEDYVTRPAATQAT